MIYSQNRFKNFIFSSELYTLKISTFVIPNFSTLFHNFKLILLNVDKQEDQNERNNYAKQKSCKCRGIIIQFVYFIIHICRLGHRSAFLIPPTTLFSYIHISFKAMIYILMVTLWSVNYSNIKHGIFKKANQWVIYFVER